MPTDKALSDTFRVGRFTAEMTVGMLGMTCEWSPHEPKPGEISKKDLKQYRAGRDKLLAQFAEMVGDNILIIEREMPNGLQFSHN
jgi:hypothetical protein